MHTQEAPMENFERNQLDSVPGPTTWTPGQMYTHPSDNQPYIAPVQSQTQFQAFSFPEPPKKKKDPLRCAGRCFGSWQQLRNSCLPEQHLGKEAQCPGCAAEEGNGRAAPQDHCPGTFCLHCSA